METLGKVAVATNSELTDVTKTGFQLQSALKIRPNELKQTFDALAFAGKAGAFELKDMAQFMPTIASAATSLGIRGKEGAVALAAMMQMVRKDAPGAAEASTRLTDALLKMTAPETVKNFKKFGVDIEKVLKDAVAKGVNPMDAAIKELIRVTGKDSFKLSQIFGDKEAKLALMALMKYKKEYEELKAAAGGAAAAGTVQKDFEASLKTFNGQLQTLQSSGELLALSLGRTLLPVLSRFIEELVPLANGVAEFVQGIGQLPKPVLDAVVEVTKLVIQITLLKKFIGLIVGAAALFKGAMALLTALTAMAGAAALTGNAKLVLLQGGITGTGRVAAIAAPLVNTLAASLRALSLIGIVTTGINYVSNVVGEAKSIEELQKRRAAGGAAAAFKGATRETVVSAQAGQRKALLALQKKKRSDKKNWRNQVHCFKYP
jgi:TP901 family phage tail tape measure protein